MYQETNKKWRLFRAIPLADSVSSSNEIPRGDAFSNIGRQSIRICCHFEILTNLHRYSIQPFNTLLFFLNKCQKKNKPFEYVDRLFIYL